ncbi:MAG: hypothetical protein GWO20_02120 [Candidatus Korarchaeota archaeon]|nr:hypothetical protein [Candidatus Korarchaeota archaeon]NIU84057.1 hypothetical protein [Candidatus Thorarchaeota archaeon]NIW12771.1 hypothetical protein [Candidatus Thorarchaeota archaeon]NIW50978.1 hypothetical protein [Candidatus Korarchaeota archaeon]
MERINKKRIFQLGNLVVPLLISVISTLFSVNGGSDWQETFSPAEYEKLLGPAGFTFAMWGPIFIFLGVFVLYQARDLFKSASEQLEMPYVFHVNGFFMLSVVAQTFDAYYVITVVKSNETVCTLSLPLAEDHSIHKFYLIFDNTKYWDGGGGANVTLHVLVDIIPPSVGILSPEDGALLNESRVPIDWWGSDPESSIDHYEVRVDGGVWIDVGANTSYVIESLSDGEHTVEVKG